MSLRRNFVPADPSIIIRTGTGLDQIIDVVLSDVGLLTPFIPGNELLRLDHAVRGAAAAGDINKLINDAVTTLGLADDQVIGADDVVAINGYIRSDASRLATFTAAHGNDENGTETGFHLVQADGAVTQFRGLNFVNTVADGLYHIGFEINADNRFANEDGNANARVIDVASWLNYFYFDSATIKGSEGNDVLRSGSSSAVFANASNEIFEAGGGNDRVLAGNGNDTLYGEAGNDKLIGDLGDDQLFGGTGDDVLRGGGGSDILNGGKGRDVLDLGADDVQDIVVFAPGDSSIRRGHFDQVHNFQSGEDKIDLTAFGGITIGGQQFSKTTNEAIIRGPFLMVDVNGDGSSDFTVRFNGGEIPVATDFII